MSRPTRYFVMKYFRSWWPVIGVAIWAIISVSLKAEASSLSSTPIKVALYQGVVTVVPTSSTILELGNNGTDIAANTGILFKPATAGALVIGQQGTTLEGGEVALLPSNAQYPEWHLDAYGDYVRFYLVPPAAVAQDKFTIGKNGDAHVIGKLCLGLGTSDFNGVSGSCIDSWADVAGSGGGSGNLETVLQRGNASNHAITISTTPGLGSGPIYEGATALLDIMTGASTPASNNAIYGSVMESFGGGSGLYAENPNGYAGYFSGRVATQTPTYSNSYTAHDMALLIRGPVNRANGYPLEIYNANSLGYAAKFTGSVELLSTTTPPNGSSFVTVTNTRTGGTTVRAISPTQSGSAVYALGEATPSNTLGLAAFAGSGSSYAAFFRGHVGVEGYFRTFGGGSGLQINNSPRHKTSTEVQVCSTSADTCLGKFIYTSSGSPPARTNATQFCYEDVNNYTTACVAAYSGAPVTQLYELR